jgi:hypothetical protein
MEPRALLGLPVVRHHVGADVLPADPAEDAGPGEEERESDDHRRPGGA